MLNRVFVLTLFFMLYLSLDCISQKIGSSIISGYITSDSTGKPVEDVNVFISNSIFGASTNKHGYYKITKVPAGTHDLVVSMVGYYVKTKTIVVNKEQNLKCSISIKPHIYELPPVEVLADRPKQWLKNYEKFKKKLLGKSEFTSDCDIQNPEILEFEIKNDNTFIAKANDPLIIVNEALGYKIDFILVSFKWKKREGKLRYIYRTRFYLLESTDEKQLLKWHLNREKAYNGSVRHFLFKLIQGEIESAGFNVFHVNEVEIKNPIKSEFKIDNPMHRLIKRDPLTNEHTISFSDFIKIIYNKETMLNIQNKIIPQVSWLKIKDKDVVIDLFGDPQGILTFELYGYWADFGVAEMLPKYYVP